MNKETIGTQTIYTKKYPVRKKKMPFRIEKKKYYEPLYGTPDCSYEGKKRGRKSKGEVGPILKVEDKKIIMYFN
tara:strand:- start:591 stop:812 length:222 start_codon:yes stop_codon:yes gene_type:complete